MINGKYLTGPSLISKSNGGFSPARLEQVLKQLYKIKVILVFLLNQLFLCMEWGCKFV